MTMWFRSWHGAPTDSKWLLIARKANSTPVVVSAIVWALFDHASQETERGNVEGFDQETYAAWAGIDEDEVSRVIDALTDKGIIVDGHLSAWEKRQPKREDDSRERVRAHRERVTSYSMEDETQTNADVTPCNADVTHGNAPEKIRVDTELVSANALTQTETESPRRARAPDPIFDTFCEVLQLDSKRLNKTERGRLNSACKDIRDVNGTTDDIRLAAERYRQKWPDIDITAKAIAGNWQSLLNGVGEPRAETGREVYGDLEENIRKWA